MAPGENAETSLRDDLAAGLKEIEEREAAANPAEEQSSAPEAQAEPEASETQADRGDGRDAHGRFVSKSGSQEDEAAQSAKADSPAAPAPPKTEANQSAPAEDQTAAEHSADTDQPPKSWRSDEAQAWKDVPPTAKAAILRRESEAAKLAGANDAERMFGREVADIFRPHIQEIQAAGASPQMALKVLLGNHNALRSNDPNVKLAKAREMLVQYGIDPSQLSDPNGPQDPHVRQLQNEVIRLRSMVGQPPQNQQYAPLPPAAEEVNIADEIERFRADPAHPHFDQVRLTMGQLMEAGAAPDLETAYNMAVASVPALRSTVPAQQPPAANLTKDTAAARRASASVASSPGPAGNPQPTSLRSELEENARRLGFL